jgi:hypothetical protein
MDQGRDRANDRIRLWKRAESHVSSAGNRKDPSDDQKLITAYAVAGLLSLVGAFALAAILVTIKTPAFGPARGDLYYRMLTGHAILGFVYWFAFIQAALLIAGATALRNGGRLWSLKLGWVAFAFIAAGLVINMVGVFVGADVLYTAFPPLAKSFPAAPLIYLGYLFVAAGAFLITLDFLATVISWVESKTSVVAWKNMLGEIHVSTFAAVCAVPLIFSIVLTAFFLYIPAFMWSMGWIGTDASVFALNFRLTYHVMFHIIHYIPAMAMIAAACRAHLAPFGLPQTMAKGLFLMYPAWCRRRSCITSWPTPPSHRASRSSARRFPCWYGYPPCFTCSSSRA